ncbi:MAG TPA: VOC family protein [Acetobacteraceae bacterium]|nr:VOC family protein [Acetobacteraceae bacterium]
MNKIAPCLWFDGKAEEAAHFYMSIFKGAKIVSIMRHGEAGPGPKGSVLAVTFELDGQRFIALNGGPHFTFTPAISLFVTCETQEEVDAFWERLSAGGEPGQCGWLKDKYGVSWQVVPSILGEMLQDTDAGKANGVMEALMKMGKLDIGKLRHAYGQA